MADNSREGKLIGCTLYARQGMSGNGRDRAGGQKAQNKGCEISEDW